MFNFLLIVVEVAGKQPSRLPPEGHKLPTHLVKDPLNYLAAACQGRSEKSLSVIDSLKTVTLSRPMFSEPLYRNPLGMYRK